MIKFKSFQMIERYNSVPDEIFQSKEVICAIISI